MDIVAPDFTCAGGAHGAYLECMARKRKAKVNEDDLQGFKHFKLLLPVLEHLHGNACRRDRAGNRKLHYDQYAALILLYFFNPVVSSLRGIQQATTLKAPATSANRSSGKLAAASAMKKPTASMK